MGLFLDLLQQADIDHQLKKTSDLSERVMRLEYEVDDLKKLVREVIARLERTLGTDLDDDRSTR